MKVVISKHFEEGDVTQASPIKNKVYSVYEGDFHDPGFISGVFTSQQAAERFLLEQGYSLSTEIGAGIASFVNKDFKHKAGPKGTYLGDYATIYENEVQD